MKPGARNSSHYNIHTHSHAPPLIAIMFPNNAFHTHSKTIEIDSYTYLCPPIGCLSFSSFNSKNYRSNFHFCSFYSLWLGAPLDRTGALCQHISLLIAFFFHFYTRPLSRNHTPVTVKKISGNAQLLETVAALKNNSNQRKCGSSIPVGLVDKNSLLPYLAYES